MYYLKNRYYDPEIRRFISADNFKSEKASMETLHNRNLFAYCDDNPLVRADQDGNAWMVAAASFVAGMGLSVGCQMIFEGKNLSEINWITAASAGLGTAMGFSMVESVNRAKDYISGALAAMLDLGKGSGPMDHGFAIKNNYTEEA